MATMGTLLTGIDYGHSVLCEGAEERIHKMMADEATTVSTMFDVHFTILGVASNDLCVEVQEWIIARTRSTQTLARFANNAKTDELMERAFAKMLACPEMSQADLCDAAQSNNLNVAKRAAVEMAKLMEERLAAVRRLAQCEGDDFKERASFLFSGSWDMHRKYSPPTVAELRARL